MFCQDALIKTLPTAPPDHSVEDVLTAIRKGNAPAAAIVGSDGALHGWFTLTLLLDNILPVSTTVGDGEASVKVQLPGAPGLPMRYKRVLTQPVAKIMKRAARVLHPETALDVAAQELLAAGGGALPVVDRATNRYLGAVTEDSLLAALAKTGA